MRIILFVVLCLLLAATVLIYFAIGMQNRAEWASDICRLGEPICDTFYLLGSSARRRRLLFSFFSHAYSKPDHPEAVIRKSVSCVPRQEIALAESECRLQRTMRSAKQPAQSKRDGNGGVRPVLDRVANHILNR